ncbi:MAG: YicC family protein [Firmicutes bacterium]|nr:YicC family protein [Bacillota bacterium]
MVCSMTGYGYESGSRSGLGLSVELRTLNHRYLDIFFRLPREMMIWEDRFRTQIKRKISRGRVEVNIVVDGVPDDVYDIKVNEPLLIAYHEAFGDIRAFLSLKGEARMEHFIQLPDLLIVQNRLGEDKRILLLAEDVLEGALEKLIVRREKEGKNLEEDLLERCSILEKLFQAARERVPAVMEQYRKNLQQKLKNLEGGYFEEGRLLTECAIFAERCDVNEEIVRLESHLQAFVETVKLHGPIGRKLDFILQEMFREINTIGSKSSDMEMAEIVVEVKTELEKMREQAQNIE